MKLSNIARLLLILAVLVSALGTVFAQTGEIADPIPYPEGVSLGDRPMQLFALDEMIVYKALDSYSEPEWVTAMVEAGELPPVADRLPVEPQVFLESGMSDGLGEYGGLWRDFSAVATEGWNLCAGQTQGWYGVNYIYGESLTKSGPMFLRNDVLEPFPNLAKGWAWSEDGMELTMDLIEGAKWSDGDPFDVEDVMFTWDDVILDDNVNSWTTRSTWQINGEDISLEAVDDYTIKFTFPVAFPVQQFFNMDFLDFNVCPAHEYKPNHPTYNSDVDYEHFQTFQTQDVLPVPTMGPWVPVEYKIDEFMVMRRNPYYWKVDETGKQLPYLDEITFEKGDSGIGRTLGTLAGSIDHSNLENPSSYVEATTRLQDDDAHFRIEWGPETLAFNLQLNLSSTLGVADDRDAALRGLFRDLRFRRALQHAVDGDGVAQAVIRGPFMRGFSGGLYPGSSYYDIDSVVYYPYSPESTMTLLAELGFEDTDGNGIVNWTDGALAGDDLVISLNSGTAAPASGQVAEAMVLLLADVGIQVNHRPLQGPAADDAELTGTWEMRVQRISSAWTVPFTKCVELGPVTNITPEWHREGGEGRELLDFEVEMVDVINEFCLEPDSEARKELMFRYNQLFTENVYNVGGVLGRYGLAIANRFRNVPVGSPPTYYQWTWGNVQPDAMWVPADEQLEQVLPETLPVYGG
jgi:peptide/nickel transport system substrate-binding protein